MLLGGRSADLFGRRRVFLIGLVIFTAASLASGLAWSPHALIVSRAVQGLGAALLLPSALAIIAPTYAGAQRTAALAIWGRSVALASQSACCLAAYRRGQQSEGVRFCGVSPSICTPVKAKGGRLLGPWSEVRTVTRLGGARRAHTVIDEDWRFDRSNGCWNRPHEGGTR